MRFATYCAIVLRFLFRLCLCQGVQVFFMDSMYYSIFEKVPFKSHDALLTQKKQLALFASCKLTNVNGP